MFKPYFKDQGGPPPLTVTRRRTVRLEDGREALGRRYGLSYLEFREAGAVLPIRSLQIDYLLPLRYLEKFSVECTLHWHEAARLNMEYRLLKADGQLATRGCSVQMMVDLSGELLLEAPAFFREFQRRWLAGSLEP